ncbi:hypothetical protein ACVIGB_007336 [Bradyrhizobium sp. USDA 4341]
MNRRAFVSGLAIAAALAGFAPAPAAADGKRVALVIGNGAYKSVPARPIRRMMPEISPRP